MPVGRRCGRLRRPARRREVAELAPAGRGAASGRRAGGFSGFRPRRRRRAAGAAAAAFTSSPSPAMTAMTSLTGTSLRALRHHDLRQRALVDRLDLHGRLVGLDLGDHVARLDLVALLLQPLGKIALSIVGDSAGMRMLIGIGVTDS